MFKFGRPDREQPESVTLKKHVAGGAILIDARTAAEYAEGCVADALNFDVTSPDFSDRVRSLDRDKTYYLYCRTGNRSGRATKIMQQLGFKAHNAGGLEELARAGFILERRAVR